MRKVIEIYLDTTDLLPRFSEYVPSIRERCFKWETIDDFFAADAVIFIDDKCKMFVLKDRNYKYPEWLKN